MTGPLKGIRIIEFSGLGPGPFCGMMLADHGAEVIKIDKIGAFDAPDGVLGRSKKSVAINTKDPAGVRLAIDLCKSADGLIEGFRPGVMERLGLGPDIMRKANPKLVYGRITGWGQTGPLAEFAGHDINYIALSGALHTCGRRGAPPAPPVNYLGDFGGGGMMLAFAMVSALLAVKQGGDGQVLDCAMTDGSALLSAMTWGLYGAGLWQDERGVNLIDSGAHFYDTYETSDKKWISIGAIEPQFYALLRSRAGLEETEFDNQLDPSGWPRMKDKMAEIFRAKTRAEWCEILEKTDVCFAPVLSLEEAPQHPHNAERGTFLSIGGKVQPAPAPRYSATQTDPPMPPAAIGADTDAVLSELGLNGETIASLRQQRVIG